MSKKILLKVHNKIRNGLFETISLYCALSTDLRASSLSLRADIPLSNTYIKIIQTTQPPVQIVTSHHQSPYDVALYFKSVTLV